MWVKTRKKGFEFRNCAPGEGSMNDGSCQGRVNPVLKKGEKASQRKTSTLR